MIKVEQVEYFKHTVNYSEGCWILLRRTGKSKITTGPTGTRSYVQHRGRFGVKKWILERKISMRDARTVTITQRF